MKIKYYAVLGADSLESEVRVIDADSPEEAAKTLFYGGDEKATPEGYNKDMEYPRHVLLFNAANAIPCPIEKIAEEHLRFHEQSEVREQEEKERAEYVRLQAKFGSKGR